MSTNLPYHPFEEDDEGNPVYPDKLPGETNGEAVARIRKMRDDHEAAKSSQQRLRERKEHEAFAQRVDTLFEGVLRSPQRRIRRARGRDMNQPRRTAGER